MKPVSKAKAIKRKSHFFCYRMHLGLGLTMKEAE